MEPANAMQTFIESTRLGVHPPPPSPFTRSPPPRTAEHNVTNEQAASHEAAMRGVAEQQDAFELEKSRMGKIFEQQQEKVKLDVGGQRFSTSMTTLLSIPESIFSSYVPFRLRKHTRFRLERLTQNGVCWIEPSHASNLIPSCGLDMCSHADEHVQQ